MSVLFVHNEFICLLMLAVTFYIQLHSSEDIESTKNIQAEKCKFMEFN